MQDPAGLIDSLHPLEIKVLSVFGDVRSDAAHAAVKEADLARVSSLDPSQVSMAVGWLLSKGFMRVHEERVTPLVSLTDIGETYFEKQAPIERILSTLMVAAQTGARLTIKEIQSAERLEPTEISSAIGCLKKERVVRIVAGGYLELTGSESPTRTTLRALLTELHGRKKNLESFSPDRQEVIKQHAVKRGDPREPFRIDERPERSYVLTEAGTVVQRGLQQVTGQEEASQLTPDLLKDGAWRTRRFRKYTISLRPPRVAIGKRHAYREFLDLVKYKLVSLGFQEMRGPLIETEFWNMDSLYMPQFHPARAIHDVYFVKEPAYGRQDDEPFLSRVAEAHQNGGDTGSTGWGYAYDRRRSQRLVLRSQGTAVSARTLAAGPRVPGKYFSIARCFRYDQVDATHATDFFQIEGIVLGADITFRTLLGLLDLFAREVAHSKESRFLPAYFPFTEPSVEVHVRHPRLGWMELGGAGLFRPEVTLPLGVDVPVIAWGLGLDRMAMVALGIHDIRDLFSSDLEKIRTMRGRFS
ncbi:MAG TPA: phenylalanine--tRNA ligase subunit alpha [Nitrospiraceae bacterium]|nr:phenylalanine--tRNA ligase subunit alpha [Nitrospiraceae bacterium]